MQFQRCVKARTTLGSFSSSESVMPGVQSLAKYGGVAVYLPVVSRFRPGDILLTLNTESDDRKELRVSRVIARATRGRFSHALICSIPPTFIEAIGPGVSTISLARCFAHNLKNVRALRYPDREVSAKAASLARLEVGRDYSRAKAIASATGKWPRCCVSWAIACKAPGRCKSDRGIRIAMRICAALRREPVSTKTPYAARATAHWRPT